MFLLDVFSEYVKKKSDSVLFLIGDGVLLNDLRAKAQKLHLENKVFIEGRKDTVNEYLNMFDVFVFPSLHEGFGLAAVEAQVNGLPVLVSDTVPSDIKIIETVTFLSLKASAKGWAEKLLAMDIQRCADTEQNFKNSGLVLKDMVDKIYSDYQMLLKK